MTENLTPGDLRQLRLTSLRLAPQSPQTPSLPSAPEGVATVAGHMFALQGQDWRASRWALGIRTASSTVGDVDAAFNNGLIVRSWPMRGTIHVVAAQDIGWMQRALNHRVLPGAARRRATLNLSDLALDRLVDTSLQALAGGASLSRTDLSNAWTDAGLVWESSWRYHVIWWMCQNGLTTFGPVVGEAEPRLVLAADWIRNPRVVSGDDALVEIATRYTSARGPVTDRDLAWWTGLTVREARRALALAGEAGMLVSVRVGEEGKPSHWVEPALLDSLGLSETGWLLLPAFDEHLLGYADRQAHLDPAHLERIIPGRNGVFQPTIVHNGRVVGTWKHVPGSPGTVQARAFPGERLDQEELARQAGRWATFHDREPLPLVMS